MDFIPNLQLSNIAQVHIVIGATKYLAQGHKYVGGSGGSNSQSSDPEFCTVSLDHTHSIVKY